VNRIAQLLLGVWAGGMAVATFTAIRAFKMLDNNTLAGDLMGGIFRTVDFFGLAAAGFVALAWFRSKPRMIFAIVLLVATAVSAFYLNPKVVARDEAMNWHRYAEILWTALFAGALGLALVGPPKKSD